MPAREPRSSPRHGSRRALFIGNFLSAAGRSRGVSEELVIRLTALGWQLRVASHRPARLGRVLDMLETAWEARDGYDVAHVEVYSGAAFAWAETVCFLLRRLGKPYVLTLHGGNLPTFARRWPRRVRSLLASANAVTAPSPYLPHALAPLAPRVPFSVIENALDLGAYDWRLRAPAAPRLRWLRAFHPLYNPVLAPAVLARLAAEHPDATLHMAGPETSPGALAAARRRADELGVSDRVHFGGPLAKAAVPGWLAAGDVFLNTTNADNVPVSVLEALACGLCVVSTDVGGLRQLLTHEEDALLVPPDDADAMAAAVHRVLAEPVLARRLSTGARRTAARFDWASVLPRWDGLLCAVAGAHPQ